MPLSVSSYVPQCVPREEAARGRWLVWAGVTTCGVALVALIFSAPLAVSRGLSAWPSAVYSAFSLVCHQMPERSFYVAGHPLAVCARCMGIYVGFAAAALVYPLLRSLRQTEAPRRAWLLAALLPMGVDFSLGFLGIWQNTHTSRFMTGLLVGAATVFYIMPGMLELRERKRRRLLVNLQTKAGRGSELA